MAIFHLSFPEPEFVANPGANVGRWLDLGFSKWIVFLCVWCASGSVVGALAAAPTAHRGHLARHPLESAEGNAYGYEESVKVDSTRRVDHVSLAQGGVTRVVYLAGEGEDASSIRLEGGPRFTVDKDRNSCGRERCVLRLEARRPEVGKAHEACPCLRLVDTLRVIDSSTRKALDSLFVHVYPLRSLHGAVVAFDQPGAPRPSLDRKALQGRANASLKFLVSEIRLDTIVRTEIPEPFRTLGFVPVLRNGIGRAKYPLALSRLCADAGSLICLHEIPYRWAWVLDGPFHAGYTRVDEFEKDFSHLYPRIGKPGVVVGEDDGRTFPVTLRFDSTSHLAVFYEGAQPPSGRAQRWLLRFDSGDNPAALHRDFPRPGSDPETLIAVSWRGVPGDLEGLVGDVLAHEMGHKLGLGDVDDPANRMHYNVHWAAKLSTPFSMSPKSGVRSGTSDSEFQRGPWIQWEERE